MNTPRTDHALQGVYNRGDHGSAIPALCRQLETELATLRANVTNLLDELQAAVIADHPEANRLLSDVITESIGRFALCHNDLMP